MSEKPKGKSKDALSEEEKLAEQAEELLQVQLNLQKAPAISLEQLIWKWSPIELRSSVMSLPRLV
jgi:hypothetical protein